MRPSVWLRVIGFFVQLWLIPPLGAAVLAIVLGLQAELTWYTILAVSIAAAIVSYGLIQVILALEEVLSRGTQPVISLILPESREIDGTHDSVFEVAISNGRHALICETPRISLTATDPPFGSGLPMVLDRQIDDIGPEETRRSDVLRAQTFKGPGGPPRHELMVELDYHRAFGIDLRGKADSFGFQSKLTARNLPKGADFHCRAKRLSASVGGSPATWRVTWALGPLTPAD